MKNIINIIKEKATKVGQAIKKKYEDISEKIYVFQRVRVVKVIDWIDDNPNKFMDSIFLGLVAISTLAVISSIGITIVALEKEVKESNKMEIVQEIPVITEEPEEVNDVPIEVTLVEFKVMGAVNLRSEPSMDKGEETIIRVLPIGESINVVNVDSDKWAELDDGTFVHTNHIAEESVYEAMKKKYDDERKPKEVARATSRTINTGYGSNSNIFVRSGESVQSLTGKLTGIYSGLIPIVPGAIELENTHGISAHITLAIAAQETGWGKHLSNTNNYFGLRANAGWISFNNPGDGVRMFGNSIRNYSKNTLATIQPIYCPPNPEWVGKVVAIANTIARL